MLIRAGIFKGKVEYGICTEPHIRPFAQHFGGTISDSHAALEDITEIMHIVAGSKEPISGYGNGTHLIYTPDLITLDEIGNEGEYTVTLKPEQMLRLMTRYHALRAYGEPTYMEVEIESYMPYPEQFPIPAEIKKLPLIKLTDPIPLPRELLS